jgi:ribosomal protein S15P/S13E
MNGGIKNFLGCSQDLSGRHLGHAKDLCSRENLQAMVNMLNQVRRMAAFKPNALSCSYTWKELEGLGFAGLRDGLAFQDLQNETIRLDEATSVSVPDLTALVNSTWELVQNYRKCTKTLDEFKHQVTLSRNLLKSSSSNVPRQLQMLHTDVNQLHGVVSRQKDALDAKKQLIQNAAERERQLQLSLHEEREAGKSCQEEV